LIAAPSKRGRVAETVAEIEAGPLQVHAATGERGRHGESRLEFAVDAEGRTYLASHFASYPHHLTRAFYLDRAAPQAATVYLQSLSGGLTQDDRVALRISAIGSAVAHVTTQAATKVHSMERGFALQQVRLVASAQSHLEFLADPTICFPHARLVARTDLCVATEASAIIGDSYMWHDPRGADPMAFDALTMETTIRRPDGRLLALDRGHLTSGHGLGGNPALLGPYRALGTLFAVGRGCGEAAAVAAVRASLADLPGTYAGVTHLPAGAGLWLRILASDGAALRTAMEWAWRRCHLSMLGWACDRRRK
jgi:urease accessory protein